MPSGFEVSRNDFLDSLQGNRNPFVDSAHWVCYIDFKSMTYKSEPDSACLEATLKVDELPIDTTDSLDGIKTGQFDERWRFYPNPAVNHIIAGHTVFEQLTLILRDMQGRLVLKKQISGVENEDISMVADGIYSATLFNELNAAIQVFKLAKG